MLVISVPGRGQEDQKFRVTLSYMMSLKPDWATEDPISKRQNNKDAAS